MVDVTHQAERDVVLHPAEQARLDVHPGFGNFLDLANVLVIRVVDVLIFFDRWGIGEHLDLPRQIAANPLTLPGLRALRVPDKRPVSNALLNPPDLRRLRTRCELDKSCSSQHSRQSPCWCST